MGKSKGDSAFLLPTPVSLLISLRSHLHPSAFGPLSPCWLPRYPHISAMMSSTDLRQDSREKVRKTAPWGGAHLQRQVSWVSRLHWALGSWVISASSQGTAALIPVYVQCSHYGSPGLQVTLHLPNFNSHAALSDSILRSSPFPEILSWPSGIQGLSTVKPFDFYLPVCSKENLALPKPFTSNWTPSVFSILNIPLSDSILFFTSSTVLTLTRTWTYWLYPLSIGPYPLHVLSFLLILNFHGRSL